MVEALKVFKQLSKKLKSKTLIFHVMRACIHDAISGEKKEVHVIDAALCQKCGICRSECKFEAILVK